MRPSSASTLPVALAAVALLLAGCAAAPTGPVETPGASPSTEPMPTVEPIVIGPAEMPPAVFGGDCSKALPTEDIAEVLGVSGLSPNESATGEGEVNLGGISCHWSTGGAGVSLNVIPRADLADAVFPADLEKMYFEDCDENWVCSWQGGDDSAWIALTFQGVPEMSRDDVDRWSEDLGARVLQNLSIADGAPWTRDRAGWLTELDCTRMAESVGSQLGDPLSGHSSGWDDPPRPAYIIAREASRSSDCWLESGSGVAVLVGVDPGLGGGPFTEGLTPVDLGIPGIAAYSGRADEYTANFVLTDGVNRITVWLNAEGLTDDTAQRFARAVAAAAASGFQ